MASFSLIWCLRKYALIKLSHDFCILVNRAEILPISALHQIHWQCLSIRRWKRSEPVSRRSTTDVIHARRFSTSRRSTRQWTMSGSWPSRSVVPQSYVPSSHLESDASSRRQSSYLSGRPDSLPLQWPRRPEADCQRGNLGFQRGMSSVEFYERYVLPPFIDWELIVFKFTWSIHDIINTVL